MTNLQDTDSHQRSAATPTRSEPVQQHKALIRNPILKLGMEKAAQIHFSTFTTFCTSIQLAPRHCTNPLTIASQHPAPWIAMRECPHLRAPSPKHAWLSPHHCSPLSSRGMPMPLFDKTVAVKALHCGNSPAKLLAENTKQGCFPELHHTDSI